MLFLVRFRLGGNDALGFRRQSDPIDGLEIASALKFFGETYPYGRRKESAGQVHAHRGSLMSHA